MKMTKQKLTMGCESSVVAENDDGPDEVDFQN
jgi:hypothetical protein